MTRLLLIRHAQAALPGDLRLPGPDLALTPFGDEQARWLANRLRGFAPVAISSSDSLRARQTAEVVAAACRIPLRITPALREIDLGTWAGRTFAEIAAAEPAASAWFSHPDTGAPPDGERAADAATRVLDALREIARDGVGPVAVVGHAGSLRLAVALAMGMAPSSWWRLRLDCASISVVAWSADGLVLERWNDTAHLGGDLDLPETPPHDAGSYGGAVDAMRRREEPCP